MRRCFSRAVGEAITLDREADRCSAPNGIIRRDRDIGRIKKRYKAPTWLGRYIRDLNKAGLHKLRSALGRLLATKRSAGDFDCTSDLPPIGDFRGDIQTAMSAFSRLPPVLFRDPTFLVLPLPSEVDHNGRLQKENGDPKKLANPVPWRCSPAMTRALSTRRSAALPRPVAPAAHPSGRKFGRYNI